ncbi:hypothetical protein L3X38_010086 [Prunus dulcis]|uniref:Uncharacterized protein n=1 Tax=Prunus dulcis TaxID=3755 RepID=A0AAD4WHA7_PRUDU|nr:hypothetical protein L3X38_010086 [Prunus dulcis]
MDKLLIDNSFAKRSPASNASYSTSLFEAWKLSMMAYFNIVPSGAEPISAVGTYGSAFVSPSQPDRPQPRGRPELAEKLCFPAEVPPKLPKLPARNSPSFLHQIDRVRHQEPDRILKGDLRGIEVARTIWLFVLLVPELRSDLHLSSSFSKIVHVVLQLQSR